MTPEARQQAFRALAAGLDRIDLDVYRAAGRDPLEPVLGEGDPEARVCMFGRDPGRHEVVHGFPFIGAGGQKVRVGLHKALFGTPMPDFAASVQAGRYVFWANMVPYKPIENKVWAPKTRAAFAPVVRDLLVHGWNGDSVLALGREAFFWFGTDKATTALLTAHWARDDRFSTGVSVTVTAPDGASRTLDVYPLPHPSPLNATWGPRFPGLLADRLAALGWGRDTWRRGGGTPGV